MLNHSSEKYFELPVITGRSQHLPIEAWVVIAILNGPLCHQWNRWSTLKRIETFVERDCHNSSFSRALTMKDTRHQKNYVLSVLITGRRGLPIEGVIVLWRGLTHFDADQWNRRAP